MTESTATVSDTSPISDKAKATRPKASSSKWMIFFFIGLLSLAADQATKIWARQALPVVSVTPGLKAEDCRIPYDIAERRCFGKPVSVVADYWDWELSMNLGSAFSMFSGRRVVLTIVGLLACLGMIWMLYKSRSDQKTLHWALAFVVGGAVGNLFDRIYFGSVTDFVLWRYQTHRWPVFNIADVVLVIGVGLMLIDILKESKRERRLKATTKPANK
jgi:signal peptidase II